VPPSAVNASPTLPRPRSPSCPAQRAPFSPAVALLWPSLPSAPSSINGDPGTRPPTFQQDFGKTQAPHSGVSPIVDQRRSRDPPADVPARLRENSGTTLGGKLRHHTRGGGKLRHHTRGGKLRHHTRGKTQAPHPGAPHPGGTTPGPTFQQDFGKTQAPHPGPTFQQDFGKTQAPHSGKTQAPHSGTTLGVENSGTTPGAPHPGGKLRHHTRVQRRT